MSEQPEFSVVPDKPFPIEVHPVGQEHLAVRGPGVDITLCVHGALTLASMLVDAANKQYCDGYIHGDASTMLVSPTVPSQPMTISEAIQGLYPNPQPTCKTFEELLGKIQDFVQKHPGASVIPCDTPHHSLGYSAWIGSDDQEVSILETVAIKGLVLSETLRGRVGDILRTYQGKIKMCRALSEGHKFV